MGTRTQTVAPGLALALGVTLGMAEARAEPNPDPRPSAPPAPHLDLLSGASTPGGWAVGVQAGFPTLGVRAQLGLPLGGLSLVGSASSTLRTDHWVLGGVSRLWIDHHRLILGGELLVGGTTRGGELARRGPAMSATLRLARGHGRVVPAFSLSSRQVLLTDRVEVQTAGGLLVERARTLAWSPQAALDVGVGVCPGFAVAAGVTLPWFEPPGFALPGAQLTLIVWDWR